MPLLDRRPLAQAVLKPTLPAVSMLVADDRIDRRVLLEADSLSKAGVAVRIVALPYPGDKDEDAAAFPNVDIHRVSLSNDRAPGTSRGRAGRISAFAPLLFVHHDRFLEAAIAKAADVVVAHDLPVLLSAMIAADALGARLFFDAHELYPEQRQLPAWRRIIYRRLERYLFPLVDTATTVNDSIAAELKRRGLRMLPSVILNLPLSRNASLLCSHDDCDLRRVCAVPPQTSLILIHGSLSRNRNLEVILDGMARLEYGRAALVLMGPDGGMQQELRDQAQGLRLLGKSVFFHPVVPQERLLATVATADIGLVPYCEVDLNTRFCTPNKLFDFIAAGLPVLASDLPELRRYVENQELGLNRPLHDAGAVAKAINAMLSVDIEKMAAKAAACAPAFAWEAQEGKFLRLFDTLTQPDRTSSPHVWH